MMDHRPIVMDGLTAIILFVFGLGNFSTEIQQLSDKLVNFAVLGQIPEWQPDADGLA